MAKHMGPPRQPSTALPAQQRPLASVSLPEAHSGPATEEPWVPPPKEPFANVLLVDEGRGSNQELGAFCESMLLSMQMRLKADAELSTFRLGSGGSSRYLVRMSVGQAANVPFSALSAAPISGTAPNNVAANANGSSNMPRAERRYVGSLEPSGPARGLPSPMARRWNPLASQSRSRSQRKLGLQFHRSPSGLGPGSGVEPSGGGSAPAAAPGPTPTQATPYPNGGVAPAAKGAPAGAGMGAARAPLRLDPDTPQLVSNELPAEEEEADPTPGAWRAAAFGRGLEAAADVAALAAPVPLLLLGSLAGPGSMEPACGPDVEACRDDLSDQSHGSVVPVPQWWHALLSQHSTQQRGLGMELSPSPPAALALALASGAGGAPPARGLSRDSGGMADAYGGGDEGGNSGRHGARAVPDRCAPQTAPRGVPSGSGGGAVRPLRPIPEAAATLGSQTSLNLPQGLPLHAVPQQSPLGRVSRPQASSPQPSHTAASCMEVPSPQGSSTPLRHSTQRLQAQGGAASPSTAATSRGRARNPPPRSSSWYGGAPAVHPQPHRVASDASIELRLCRSLKELFEGLSELRLLQPPREDAWQARHDGAAWAGAGPADRPAQPSGSRQPGGASVGRWVAGSGVGGCGGGSAPVGTRCRSIVLEGRCQGQAVAVKLVAGPGLEARSAALGSALAAVAVLHPNLVRVHGMRLLPPAAAGVCRLEAELELELQQGRPGAGGGGGGSGGKGGGAGGGGAGFAAREALAALERQAGEGLLAVVMELCSMGSLAPLARAAYSPFRPNRAWPAYLARRALLRTALEVAGPLAHLHALRVVHGALSADNVLLVPALRDRRTFYVKVSDVGLACGTLSGGALAPAAADAAAGLLCLGVAPAPAVEPPRPPGGRSPAEDVLAFGRLLWELAAGQAGPEGPTLRSGPGGARDTGGDARRAAAWPGGAHPHLQPLYEACVCPEPEQRPTMEQVCCELSSLDEALRRERPHIRAAAAAGYAAFAAGREGPATRLPGFML